MARASRFLLDLFQEHLEELDFLWEQRDRVVFAHTWSVDDLAGLEERAEAHLDALRIGGPNAIDVARPALMGEEPGAAMAAALVLLAARSQPLADEVMAAFRDGEPPVRDGIRRALRHGEVALATDRLYECSTSGDIHLRACAADVLAFHRLRPPPDVERLLEHEDPAIAALGCRAAGRFGRLTQPALERALAGDDARLRRVALEEAARCGMPELPRICRAAVTRAAARDAESIAFLGVIGEVTDLSALKRVLTVPAVGPAVLAAMGALGNVAAMSSILDAMTREPLAPAAGDAFRRITGIEDIGTVAPVPTADSDDADVEEPEPLPDAARARATWDGVAARFAAAGCWQHGVDVATLDLRSAERVLPLALRRDFVLRRRATDKAGTPDVELERRVRV